ncbi:MAG: hypothetical protein J0M12_06170 [Deltaproteobacteria bacterium]|nr:hypothetical protein [Deltaproteobacteria bacterium]
MAYPSSTKTQLALSICRDLIFSSKISGAARNAGWVSRSVRSLEDLHKGLAEKPAFVLLDLNITGLDVAAAISAVQATEPAPNLIGYFSHVETESAREARRLGVGEIYARSKFVQILPELFSPLE